MTIRKGEEWGSPVDRPEALHVVSSDRELGRLIATDRNSPVAVVGGDIAHSLGDPGLRPTMQCVPMDLVHVDADGRPLLAVAHVIVRRPWWRGSWWRGPVLALMNVDHLGGWNVAPRAHPNDGRVDIVDVDASFALRQRWQAWRRLPGGTHVPHPSIRVSRASAGEWDLDRPARLWIDGIAAGRVRRLSMRVEPDAYDLHV